MKQPVPADEAVRDDAAHDLRHNIFLDAGAGTGKTASLVSRYLAILEASRADGGADVDAIVAITFTRKAAREMKERLRRECHQRAARLDGEEALLWRRRARRLENAPIGTIHSFCSTILRRFPLAANVDPQFAILHEVEAQDLLRETVRETLLQRLDDGDESARVLLGAMELSDAVGAIESLIGAHRDQVQHLLQNPADGAALLKQWHEHIASRLADADDLRHALDTLLKIHPADETDKLAAVRSKAIEGLQTALDSNRRLHERMDALCRLTEEVALRGGSAKKWPSKEQLDAVKQALRQARDAAEKLARGWDPEVEQHAAHVTAALYAEARAAIQAYDAAKADQSALDYDDLQLRARDLLRDHPAVRAYYQRRYRHILVDEFQDTNRLQKEIIWYLAEEGQKANCLEDVRLAPGKLFVVGDAKQSVYRFRGADVSVFNTTREEFEKDSQRCKVLRLQVSFRSQPSLIAFHNDLFSRPQVMGPDSAHRADYEAFYQPLQAHRPSLGDHPPVEFLVAAAPDSQDRDAPKPGLDDLREVEADLIARCIQALLGQPIVGHRDDGSEQPRAAQPGDFAILFRASTDLPVYERALRQRGIPFHTAAGSGFYARQEVKDVLNLLSVLANINDEVSLVGLLRSPFFGLSDRTLFWLTDIGPHRSLLSSIQQAAGDRHPAHPHAHMLDDAEREKVAHASRTLSLLHEFKDRMPVSALISRAIEETGYTAALAAQWAGEQMVANVRSLIHMAADFERRGRFSLGDFVAHLRDLVKREHRRGLAPLEEEQDPSSVKLMTIHAAKGLEWPIVIVADLARKRGSDTDTVRFLPDLGAAVQVNSARDVGVWPAIGRLIQRRTQAEEEAEVRRLFYVACTRARDRLILSTPLPAKKPEEWLKWLTCGDEPLLDPKTDSCVRGNGWRMKVHRAGPGHVEPTTTKPDRRKSLAQRYPKRLEKFEPLPGADEASILAARRRIQPVSVPTRAYARFSVTRLCAYLRCPSEYELRYVRGLPEAIAACDLPFANGRLSPMQRGLLLHRVLQIVGRSGKDALEGALKVALAGAAVPDEDKADIREMAQWYLTDPAYSIHVSPANKLRSEMTIIFPLGDALIEGKIDALAEHGSELHLLDYKTGEEPQEEALNEHKFQVGLYAFGVNHVLGRAPATASIVYLASQSVTDLALDGDVDAARASAEEALKGITEQQFEPNAQSPCATCRLRWACPKSPPQNPPRPEPSHSERSEESRTAPPRNASLRSA